MYQQAPFNNEPSSGSLELDFFRMFGAGKNILDNVGCGGRGRANAV